MYGLGWEGDSRLPRVHSPQEDASGSPRLPPRPGSGSPQTCLDEDLAWAGHFLSCASSEWACCGGHCCPGQARSLRGKALSRGGCDGVWSCWSVSHSSRLLAHLPQIRKSPSLICILVLIYSGHHVPHSFNC